MEDVCCKRFGVPLISAGLFRRIPTGGGGGAKNPDAADGGNEVTVAISTHTKKNAQFVVFIKERKKYKFQKLLIWLVPRRDALMRPCENLRKEMHTMM